MERWVRECQLTDTAVDTAVDRLYLLSAETSHGLSGRRRVGRARIAGFHLLNVGMRPGVNASWSILVRVLRVL